MHMKSLHPLASTDATDSAEIGQARPLRHQATPSSATLLLVALLGVDGLLILGHVGFFAFGLDDGKLLLSYARGYGELFMYAKFAALATAAAALALWRREFGWLWWAFLFAFLCFDDAYEAHEQVGRQLGDWLAVQMGMDPRGHLLSFRWRDLGEALYLGGAALLILGPLVAAYRRGGPVFRKASRRLAVMLLLLIICGIGFDLLHRNSLLQEFRAVVHMIALMEDGGELVVVSLMAWMLMRSTTRGFLESQVAD